MSLLRAVHAASTIAGAVGPCVGGWGGAGFGAWLGRVSVLSLVNLTAPACTQTPDVVARLRSTATSPGATPDVKRPNATLGETTDGDGDPDGGRASTHDDAGTSSVGTRRDETERSTGGATSADGSDDAFDDAGVTQPRALELSGELEAHDPSLISARDGRYYLFHTGDGIPYKMSEDLTSWSAVGRVFEQNPTWIAELVPEATGLWAPDVGWAHDRYHLYYAASTFGSGRSCIGHATTPSLGSSSAWEDHGPVICSDVNGTDDDWDAIDPSQITDANEQRWLVFGSFGSGIYLIALDEQGRRQGDELFHLARRPEPPRAIQAPFLWYREPYYYLLVSFDWCCRGVDSTHHLRVGRSESLLGPYVDQAGVPMLEGGGSIVLAGNERWRAVGAGSLFTLEKQDYVVYHAYDANAVGNATLRIAEITWDREHWPVFGEP